VTPPNEPSKKGYQWRLSEQALRDGRVQSTTRFRNKQPNKRGSRSQNPAPHRQASGAKGGRMARMAAEARRSERLREAKNHIRQSFHNLRSSGMIPSDMAYTTAMSVPVSPSHVAASAMVESGASSPYNTLEQMYDWYQHQPQHGQLITVPDLHNTNTSQHETYITSPPDVPNNTPARTPEVHWGTVGDRIFFDSSDPTTPATTCSPSSFGDIGMDPSVFSLGNLEECHM
jgi:hypothetical protein